MLEHQNTEVTLKPRELVMRKVGGVDGDAQRINQLAWLFFLNIVGDLETTKSGSSSPVTATPYPSHKRSGGRLGLKIEKISTGRGCYSALERLLIGWR